jgi:hypothetical protein
MCRGLNYRDGEYCVQKALEGKVADWMEKVSEAQCQRS